MAFRIAVLLAALASPCAAFAPTMAARPALARAAAARSAPVVAYTVPEPDDMWWGDKEYPPSKVLGIGKDVPSLVYGLSSGIVFFIGCYCVAASNLLNILSGSTVNGWLVFGSLGVAYAWG
jgi:hypothetical protein